MTNWLKRFMPKTYTILRGKQQPPVIVNEYGNTTEKWRHQAALNMKANYEVKARVEALLIAQCGSVERGLAEARRRFPEAYED